jgi:hypothetical protein
MSRNIKSMLRFKFCSVESIELIRIQFINHLCFYTKSFPYMKHPLKCFGLLLTTVTIGDKKCF